MGELRNRTPFRDILLRLRVDTTDSAAAAFVKGRKELGGPRPGDEMFSLNVNA
jgi:hypothetical protein